MFRERPLAGYGAGDYDRRYFLERATTEDIRQPHSIELQTLAELGLLGAALVLVLIAAVSLGRHRRLARRATEPGLQRGLLVAGVGVTSAVAAAHERRLAPSPARGHRDRDRGGGAAAQGQRRRCATRTGCRRTARADDRGRPPARGGRLLARARRLRGARALRRAAGVAGRPVRRVAARAPRAALRPERRQEPVRRGRGARALRQRDGARRRPPRRLSREPHNFVTWALLGDLDVRRGDLAEAAAAYGRASQLNPQTSRCARSHVTRGARSGSWTEPRERSVLRCARVSGHTADVVRKLAAPSCWSRRSPCSRCPPRRLRSRTACTSTPDRRRARSTRSRSTARVRTPQAGARSRTAAQRRRRPALRRWRQAGRGDVKPSPAHGASAPPCEAHVARDLGRQCRRSAPGRASCGRTQR